MITPPSQTPFLIPGEFVHPFCLALGILQVLAGILKLFFKMLLRLGILFSNFNHLHKPSLIILQRYPFGIDFLNIFSMS